jgi:hypothetical protein
VNEHKKHEMFLYGGVIGGVVILYFVLEPHANAYNNKGKVVRTTSSPPQRQMSSHPSTMPNPAQASVDEAFIQARAAAIGMYDQTVLGEKTSQDQLIAANNETLAQKQIAFNQDSTAYKIAGVQSTTAIDVAGTQASAAENIASQQASMLGQLEHTSQQQSFWGGIMSFFSQAISGLLGGGFGNLFGSGLPLQGSTGQPTFGGANQNPPY